MSKSEIQQVVALRRKMINLINNEKIAVAGESLCLLIVELFDGDKEDLLEYIGNLWDKSKPLFDAKGNQ